MTRLISNLGQMTLSVAVNEKLVQGILRTVIKDVLQNLNHNIRAKLPAIESQVKLVTQDLLRDGTMYKGVLFGDLAGQFGFPAEEVIDIINTIVDTIADDISIKFNFFNLIGDRINGGISVNILKRTYDRILSLREAKVHTEKGDILPWLEWTLFRGGEVIIFDYFILLDIGKGRSGLAIMVEKEGRTWSVPPEVAGTEDDNWITREILTGLQTYRNIIDDIIEDMITQAFRKL